ncbi:hypothetical protein Nepgr_004643 [Nepenthes gracilis]|uniref:Secreted protein n=1 Tax=Nepenthes gracilis TaxID=150966 RepID=A0AAD3XFD5_NEPGR|nr:hypothetical protein Nepgr_004643 [Nepenthes gracilis]
MRFRLPAVSSRVFLLLSDLQCLWLEVFAIPETPLERQTRALRGRPQPSPLDPVLETDSPYVSLRLWFGSDFAFTYASRASIRDQRTPPIILRLSRLQQPFCLDGDRKL